MEKRDILLFQYPEQRAPSSHLKNFIQFLACAGIDSSSAFSYGDSEGALISNLTLRENIHLDLFWKRLECNNFSLEKFFAEHDNRHLNQFFGKITLLDEYPKNVDEQTRKITTLLKALLRQPSYLFLDSPEKHLYSDNLDIFFKALDCERWKLGLTVLIFSEKGEALREYVNKDVFCSENKKFVVKSRLSSVRDLKQVTHRLVRDPEGLLEFSFPKTSKKKIA